MTRPSDFRLWEHGRCHCAGRLQDCRPCRTFILPTALPAKAEALAAELGCNTTTNAEVAGRSDLIFLAVKPQMMEALLAPLKFTLNERPSRFILCSMAAGLSIARIQEMAGKITP